jgi:type I restriction enzyme S subunit
MALNRPILGDNLKVTRICADDLPAILYQRVARLRAMRSEISPYVFFYLLTAEFRELVRGQLVGTDQPYLNVSLLPKFGIPFPPLREQEEIVRHVEALFKLAETIETRVAAGTRMAERLTQAILTKAFRGELVPTEAEIARREGRVSESASELFSRISRHSTATATGHKDQQPAAEA